MNIDVAATERYHARSNQIDIEATEAAWREPFQYAQPREPDVFDTAAIIGLEIIPALAGGFFGGLPGGAIGSTLGNYMSQRYRIDRGFQEDLGYGELGAAAAFGAVPIGQLKNVGTVAKTAIRTGQGAGLATGELYARTYLDEDRAPTRDEIASTVLFGGAFGGGLGAIEAKWLSKNMDMPVEEGATRPEVIKLLENKVREEGGPQNFEVGRPMAQKLNVLRQQELDVDSPLGLPAPRTGSDVVIEVEGISDYSKNLFGALENKLLLEAEGEVSKIARLRGEEATEQMAGLQKDWDAQVAQQDEIFTPLMKQVDLGVQKVGDNAALREVQEQLAMLDHKHGKNKGASNQRRKLKTERQRILKRNNLVLDDLEGQMRAGQMPPNRQDVPFEDQPMKQADPMTKYDKLAEEKLRKNYEKYFQFAMVGGAGGATALGLLTNEDEDSEFKQAGMPPVLAALMLAMGLRGRAARRFMRSSQFKRASADAKKNPSKVEPDTIKAERVQQTAQKAEYVKPSQLRKLTESAKEFVSNTLTPLSRKLKNIDPFLNGIFRGHEREINTRTRQYLDRVSPFITSMTKRLKGNKAGLREFKQDLLNGNYKKIVVMMDDLGIVDKTELTEMKKALSELRDYAREEGGIDVGYIEDYFPRQVEDYKSFKRYLDDNNEMRDVRNQVEQALEEYRAKHKYESLDLIPPEEAAEVASRVLRGYPVQAGAQLPGNLKERKIKEVTPEMLDAYADPADALRNYVDRVVQATERKKFLFRKPSDAGAPVGFEGSRDQVGTDLGMRMEVDESLAGQVAKRLLKGNKKYSAEDIEKLRDIIQSRFSGKTVSPFIQGVKNLNYIQVMGNFGSAITQLGDLAYSMHFHGFGNTFRSLVNRKENYDFVKHFNLKNHNIDAATSTDGLSNALDKVFTITGLKKLDQLGKNTTMNASWRKYKAQAMGDSKALQDDLTPVFGAERSGQMVKELRDSTPNSKELPKAVEELIWYKFLDLNPATLGEMPKYYNASGNARILYMLKTFTIKQFDVAREAGIESIRLAGKAYAKGDNEQAAKLASKGMKGLVGLATVFAAANAGTDVIKDLLYGRPIKRDELLENNLLKLIGINRYLVHKGKREGPAKAFLEGLLPPTTAFDRAFQDISAIAGDKDYKGAMLQGTPLDMVYWKYLGGLDKIENMQ